MEACKSNFQCSNDPCVGVNGRSNLCSRAADCVPTYIAHSYTCTCRQGYVGDGFVCKKLQAPPLSSHFFPPSFTSGLPVLTRRQRPGQSAAAAVAMDYCAMSQHLPHQGRGGRGARASDPLDDWQQSSHPSQQTAVAVGHTCVSPCRCENSAQEQGYRYTCTC